MIRRGTVLVAATLLALILAVLLTFGAPRGSDAASCVARVPEGGNLARIAENKTGPCTFVVDDGGAKNAGENVLLQDDDMVRPETMGGPRSEIDGQGAAKVIVSDGEVRLEGIRVVGSSGNDACAPGCALGVQVRSGRTVLDGVASNGHPNMGVSVSRGAVARFEGGEYHNNGSANFTRNDPDQEQGEYKGSAAGVKVLGRAVFRGEGRVTGSYWNGIWCDNSRAPGDDRWVRGTIDVRGWTFSGNAKNGIQNEGCVDSLIENNRFLGNGRSMALEGYGCPNICGNLGVMVSLDTLVRGNLFRRTKVEYTNVWGNKPFPTGGNRIVSNTLRDGARVVGCAREGVTCRGNG